MSKEELEVGMYVRTKFGVIDKCVSTIVDYSKELIQCETREISKHQITKVRHSIIDLVQVGDYVNGLKVRGITDFGLSVTMFGDIPEILEENEIKSIVTKEQFESMSYKIGD